MSGEGSRKLEQENEGVPEMRSFFRKSATFVIFGESVRPNLENLFASQ
jgi:hypothetical protein